MRWPKQQLTHLHFDSHVAKTYYRAAGIPNALKCISSTVLTDSALRVPI